MLYVVINGGTFFYLRSVQLPSADDITKYMDKQRRYFVAKCDSVDRLKTASKTCIWACRDRNTGPQPRDVLIEAMSKSDVILIFSVNGSHGWHGYAQMISTPDNNTSVPCHGKVVQHQLLTDEVMTKCNLLHMSLESCSSFLHCRPLRLSRHCKLPLLKGVDHALFFAKLTSHGTIPRPSHINIC